MDVQDLIKLFDLYWFGHEVITKPPPSSYLTIQDLIMNEKSLKPVLSPTPSREVPLLSDGLSSQSSSCSECSTPRSVLPEHRLHTLLSSKEVYEESPEKIVSTEKYIVDKTQSHRVVSSKSLSELELEELKGFMDLGFVFSEEDKNSSLVSIIPGLQRLGKQNHQEEEIIQEKKMVSRRPYLSEAWQVMDAREEQQKKLMNWKFAALSNETDMKDQLRCWAHTVATAVR